MLNNDITNTSSQTKLQNLWKIQLNILKEIDNICQKNDISYFAISGTLLGAIRHNGYIPWDDDLDIGMTRDNYNKFLKVASKELKNEYFLQTSHTEKNFFRVHAQVRYSNSTMLTKGDYNHKYNMGVWVDIFVYDKCSTNEIDSNKFRNKVQRINKIMNWYMFYKCSSFFKSLLKYVLSRTYVLLNGGLNNVIKKYDKLLSMFNNLTNNYVYDQIAWAPNTKLELPYNYFDNLEKHKFENTFIPIPKNYELDLIKEFGSNYMTPIKADSAHGATFIDLNNSYKKYQSLKKNEYMELFK